MVAKIELALLCTIMQYSDDEPESRQEAKKVKVEVGSSRALCLPASC